MANNTRAAAKRKRSVNARQVARDWLSRGVAVVPLRNKSKKPKTREEEAWNKVRIGEEQIDEYFDEGDNVGGLWGKPSGWIIDVDLDWDEAAAFAPSILPETFIYGRASRPSTHFLYRCKDVKTFKRSTFGQNGEVIIEVRSTGTQSVLPPSIHPSGERFEINHEADEFTKITPKRLEQLVNRIAAGAVFARHYPEGGGRHDFVHALTGALLWSQWDSEDVASFMSGLLDVVGARESDRGQRERTVINTIEKYENQDKVNGWPTLEQWIAPQDVANCRKWCSVKGLAPGIKLKSKADDESAEEVPDDLEATDAEAVNPRPSFIVPGLVGKIAAWVHRNAYANQPLFDLGAALTILALATQNKYIVQTTNTPLSPFFMALGRTGGGKDSARQAVSDAAHFLSLHERTFGGFQSFHALLDELAKPPHTMCWLWDEAARRLKAASRSSSGPDSQVLTWLLDLYGKGRSTVLGMPGRKQSVPAIKHPFLVVMALAQPEQMIESITTADISTGLLNRFILLDSGDGVAPLNYPDHTGVPSAVANPLLDIVKMRLPEEKEFIEIGWETTRTWNLMKEFREECRILGGTEISSGEIWGRAWQNALILCGLVAVGCDAKRPKITEDIAKWACEFMRWSCNNWTIRISASSARSLTERFSKDIERIVREPHAFRKFARPNELKIIGKQLMPKSLIHRVCRNMKSRDITEALAHLCEADVIGEGEKNGVEVFWYKSA